MKVAIFAGGLGTHLSEETEIKPKRMVEIGKRLISIVLLFENYVNREGFCRRSDCQSDLLWLRRKPRYGIYVKHSASYGF